MAPFYAVDSFVGFLDFQGSKAFFMFLDAIKECYEAFVSVYMCILNSLWFQYFGDLIY